MAAKKSSESTGASGPSAMLGSRRNLVLLFGAVGALAVVATEAWKHWGASRAHWEAYDLTWQAIQLEPPPPSYVKSDVKGELARRTDAVQFSLLDRDITRQVAQTFALHPWVRRVDRVTKAYPAALTVKLEYRLPVAMVEVSHKGVAGLLPVDRDGVLLPPADFSAGEARSLPRIRVMNAFPAASVGSPWGDARVQGAATLAAILLERWNSTPLFYITNQPLAAGQTPEATVFELVTREDRHIVWGQVAPQDSSENPAVIEKIAKLWAVLRSPGNAVVDLRRDASEFDPPSK